MKFELRASLFVLALIVPLLACNLGNTPSGVIPTATPLPILAPTAIPPEPIPGAAQALFNGDYDTARAQYTAASAVPANKCDALYGLGVTELRAANNDAAESAFTRALSECPPAFRAYLLRGEARRLQSKSAEAIADYQQALTLKPGLIDSYLYERMSLTAQSSAPPTGTTPGTLISNTPNNNQQNEQLYLAKAAEAPRYLAGQFALRNQLAQAQLAVNNPAEAIRQYDAILAAATLPGYRAQVEVAAALAEIAAQQLPAAYTRLNRVLSTYPDTSAALDALVLLVNANQPVDTLLRSRINVRNENYPPVVNLLTDYLTTTPANQIPAELYVLLGQSQRGIGDNASALATFQKVRDAYPKDPMASTAALEQGRTYFAAKDYPKAIAAYSSAAAAYPDAAEAPEALWRAGYLEQTFGDPARAITLYDQLGAHYPTTERAAQGLFDAGMLLSTSNPTRAASFFGRVGDARGYLWQGKMLQQAGDAKNAQQAWTTAATKEPTTFWGLRARDLLAGTVPYASTGTFNNPPDTDIDQAAAERWMQQTFGLPAANTALSPTLNVDPMLTRGTELWALGWWLDARAEFDALYELHRDEPLTLFQLAAYYKSIGVYRSSLIAATRVISLSKLPASAVPPYIARLAYPINYADLLIPEAQSYSIDPLYLCALIRLESNFDANARSGSDARGLTQVVPLTANDIVGRLKWPPNYKDTDLYRPFISMRFGAYYVDFVKRYLGGNLAATLAGYNAGPGAARAWLQKAGDDLDRLYETISSQQAQDYIRYTYEYFSVYKEVYGHKS